MSIEIPLIRALAIFTHYRGERNPRRCAQITLQIRNARSAELKNQNICRNVFPKKAELKHFWGWVRGSLNLHKQFQFGFQGSVSGAVASAGFSVSDESSESDGADKIEVLSLSMNLPDEEKKIQESELGHNGGPEIQNGDGQGGDGMGKNNSGFGGSEGGHNDLLRGLEWWWWWQWKRAHRRSHTSLRRGYTEPLWVADSVAQEVGAQTMRSLEPAVPAIDELIRLLRLDEMVVFALMLPFIVPILYHMHDEVSEGMYFTMGAILALLTVALLAVMCWHLHSWWNCDDNDNDNGNDTEDDNADLYL